MNYEEVILHFLHSQYDFRAVEINGRDCLQVTTEIATRKIDLVHICESEMTKLPSFYLKNAEDYGELAHVLPIPKLALGSICVNDLDSVSVNYNKPELAFEESLKRHIGILDKAISDPDWNRRELIREFKANWDWITPVFSKKLLCASRSGHLEKMSIFEPFKRQTSGTKSCYIGISESSTDLNLLSYLQKVDKRTQAKVIGYVIPLDDLAPAPCSYNELSNWYIDAMSKISANFQNEFKRHYAQFRSNEFWLVFNAPTPSGVTWFGLKLTSSKKTVIPLKQERLATWKFERLIVDVFNKELLMPRSGANTALDDKNVLLIGCGSVGSELAFKLGSAGLGSIQIADPDSFSYSNIYRHTLSKHWLETSKSVALAIELSAQFPWIKANGLSNKLLDFRDYPVFLEDFDLIIIAIGSPTHERLFHDFLKTKKVKTPVINTWLEGHGIGGHATLDIPNSRGCLGCAYVQNDTGIRGLVSNLNFFEANQNIIKNYAGCGETYIPYGAISSAQTALVASNLAILYLEGKVSKSKKVSWKGGSADAIKNGIKCTQRYENFNQSLIPTNLYNPRCSVCRGEPGASYEGEGLLIHISQDVLDQWKAFRQLKSTSVEYAGLLVGHRESEAILWIDGITTPKKNDINKRNYYKLDDQAHQAEINHIFIESLQIRGYLGTWHTHPQDLPTPSPVDYNDWREHVKDNTDRPLFFVVIGRQLTKIIIYKSGPFVTLNRVGQERI